MERLYKLLLFRVCGIDGGVDFRHMVRSSAETEPLGLLLRAGFYGLFYEKLGAIQCFSVNGVELRELRLHGWKPGATEESKACSVVYKRPFEEVSCECGAVFRRGQRVEVSALVASWLRSGPAADSFAFLPG